MPVTHDMCLQMVREQDRARYLTTLYAPASARPKLWALHAFNIELARIRESVSEPMIGEIRLAWWRETLDGVYAGQPRQHPVAEALLCLTKDVPQDLLTQMIDGRMTDVYDGHLADFPALETYARQSGGAQQAAVAHALGLADQAVQVAAYDIGTAWSMLGIVRAIEFHARMQRVYLPEEELRGLGLDPESLFQRPIGPEIVPLVRRICERVSVLGQQARQHCSRGGLPAFLLMVLADDYQARLFRAGYDVTRASLDSGDMWRQLKLLRASLTGRC